MRGGILYWHFVDIVWIAVYGIIYVVSLFGMKWEPSSASPLLSRALTCALTTPPQAQL